MSWWHGGPRIHGDVVLPPSRSGFSRVTDGEHYVYVTPTRSLAETYGATINGWVYEVAPIGGVEQDPDSVLPAGESTRCAEAAILRRFKLSRRQCAEAASVVGEVDRMLFGG